MTMVYCRTCGRDVHITHSEDECEGTPDKSTPSGLKQQYHEPRDEPAEDAPDVY